MSRSRKKNPICGIACAESEKKDKKIYHGRMRAATKRALASGKEMPHPNEVTNVWSWAKDGKQYIPKSSKYHKRVLRK